MPPNAPPQESARSANQTDCADSTESAADAMRGAAARLAELRKYAGYYLAAKIDRIKLTIRQFVALAIVGLLGLVVAAGMLVTAVVLTLDGIAGGLAKLCDNTRWLGDLLCGVIVLSAITLMAWISLRRFASMNLKATVDKYERDRTEQRGTLGHDVAERAAEAPHRG